MDTHFKAGFVAVVGKPNVGKSTLINELIGQKLNITSHKPQTTRHRINSIDTTSKHQLILVDTPGIHLHNKNALNRYMNRTASGVLNDVDVVLWLLDSHQFGQEDRRVLQHIKQVQCPTICCINKIDKFKSKTQLLAHLSLSHQHHQFSDIVPISAFNKKDVAYLKVQILKYLPTQPAIFDPNYLTDKSEQFIIAEFIREKLVRLLAKELPYGVTVEVEQFSQVRNSYRIAAKILVERASQKRIIIGKNGKMLKQIGSDARYSIEHFLLAKVYLKLWVSIASDWRNSRHRLESLGYK